MRPDSVPELCLNGPTLHACFYYKVLHTTTPALWAHKFRQMLCKDLDCGENAVDRIDTPKIPHSALHAAEQVDVMDW